MKNQLILGDNLEVLKKLPSESVDLCYIDPPFFSNRNYEVIWGDDGEIRSFKDRWSGGITHYTGWLYERVEQIYRVLKSTGSLYLHCDWHANAYIRVDILDKIFGMNHFRCEIIWQRHNSHNDAKKKFSVLTDTIWYYTKSNKSIYNPIYGSLDEKYTDSFYKYDDGDGKGLYKLVDMSSPNSRPNMMYEWKGFPYPLKGWRYKKETMEILDNENRIFYPKDTSGKFDLSKRPRSKKYLSETKGQLLSNLWFDIRNVQGSSKEHIGYPTQKPLALLERIIKASSNEGDVVLDAFCGGGTTLVAAQKLNRRFIGIDQSVQAIAVSQARLEKEQDLFSATFSVERYKYDYEAIRNQPAFEFESFIIEQFGGNSNSKQRSDGGIDGIKKEAGLSVPIQVKRSDNIGRNVIDNFKSAMARFDKTCKRGYIIGFSFGKGAVEEAARLKRDEGIEIILKKVEEIIPIAKPPRIEISYEWKEAGTKKDKEITFVAKGDKVEIWQWDFEYNEEKGFKGEIMLDKKGKQTKVLSTGKYQIAVRGVDKDGLEAIEVITIVINGGVCKE
ncbi:MAG: restriction endonuclease [Endomicrobium sp.]|jgi:DNA modification methylase|nr:restriction endonuclease [Endomicrobium sp.]